MLGCGCLCVAMDVMSVSSVWVLIVYSNFNNDDSDINEMNQVSYRENTPKNELTEYFPHIEQIEFLPFFRFSVFKDVRNIINNLYKDHSRLNFWGRGGKGSSLKDTTGSGARGATRGITRKRRRRIGGRGVGEYGGLW